MPKEKHMIYNALKHNKSTKMFVIGHVVFGSDTLYILGCMIKTFTFRTCLLWYAYGYLAFQVFMPAFVHQCLNVIENLITSVEQSNN